MIKKFLKGAVLMATALMTAQSHSFDMGDFAKAVTATYRPTSGAASTGSRQSGTFDVEGKGVHTDDGDTVVLLVDGNTQMKIRLASIDAPESSHTNQQKGRIGQPYSDNSARYLKSLVNGRNVRAHCFEKDHYRRDVCELFVDGQSVNREMVARGWAWANAAANGRYMRDESLPSLESSARTRKIGLWAGANPVAPWQWRDVCWKQGQCQQ